MGVAVVGDRVVGTGVGLPGMYVGLTVGDDVGTFVGRYVGTGVGLPSVYVGFAVGLRVGVVDGSNVGGAVGNGVGNPG